MKGNFLGNDIPKENIHYTCIACITIDSVVKMDEKYLPQVYLEEFKYKTKKTKMWRFINAESKSDSDDDSDSDSDDEKPLLYFNLLDSFFDLFIVEKSFSYSSEESFFIVAKNLFYSCKEILL